MAEQNYAEYGRNPTAGEPTGKQSEEQAFMEDSLN
jgi:hypothetical protein